MVETEGVVAGGFLETFRQPIEAQTPLGRIGQTEDVAPTAVFLASSIPSGSPAKRCASRVAYANGRQYVFKRINPKERGIPMHYLLFYEVGDDYASRRAEFREAHLENAWKGSERGELVLGGALANPMDGAVLLFKGESPEVAENFARTDPYVTSGTVKRWFVREWTTVVGEDAATPVSPSSLPPATRGRADPQTETMP
jgi:uncharacterized protein